MHPSVVVTLLRSAANRSYEEEANQRLDKEMEDSEMRRHRCFQTFPISSCASFKRGTGDPQTLTGEGAPSTRFETRSFEEGRVCADGAELYHDFRYLLFLRIQESSAPFSMMNHEILILQDL